MKNASDSKFLITRRNALLGATGLGLAAAAGTGRARADQPKSGGHLKIGIDTASSADTLDPGVSSGAYVETTNFTYGNCLVELDEQAKAIPELAESWEPSKDAKTWVFKLRKGVTFHNGKSFTSEDVIHTINHHRAEASKSGAKGVLINIEEITASGASEITVKLKSASADLPYLFSATQLQILPAGEKTDAGIGTGAYVIEQFQPGIRVLAKKNANYWKEGRGHVDSVEIIALNDPIARVSAVRSGAVDIIQRLDPKVAPSLESTGLQVIRVPSSGHYTLPMRCDTDPFTSKDVRLALKHAIDREEIVKKIMGGYGTIGNDHPIPHFDPFFASDLPQHEYDPDKAASLFKKAGVSGPIVLKVAQAGFPGAVESGLLFQNQAKKAGIDIQIERVPEDGYWDSVWLKVPFCSAYWSGKPTADLMLTNVYLSTSPWNDAAWKRPDFDELLTQARGELDNTKRKQMYHDLQEMIWDDGGTIVLAFNDWLFAAQSNVAGLVRCPVATGRRMSEQLYFAS